MNIIAIDLGKFNSVACLYNLQTPGTMGDEVESVVAEAAINRATNEHGVPIFECTCVDLGLRLQKNIFRSLALPKRCQLHARHPFLSGRTCR